MKINKILENIFSIKDNENHKIFNILGIKIKFLNTKRIISNKQNKILSNQECISEKQNVMLNNQNRFAEQINCNNAIQKQLFDKYVISTLYNKNIWEKQYLTKFIEELVDINLEKSYINLISQLDDFSIKVVNFILSRIFLVTNSTLDQFDIFTKEEKDQITQLSQKFFNNILMLNEKCFVFNKYLLPVNHFEICVFKNKHEIGSLNQKYFQNKDIIDAGGFIGDSAIVFSDYTSKKVHTFEPTKENYGILLKTIEINNKGNIIPNNIGLSDKIEQFEINFAGSASGIFAPENTKKKEIVEMITLDSYVQTNNLEVGLIKTDLEGFEQQFLRGAENTIKTQRPTLLISIYHSAYDFFNIKPLIESWNLGYKFRIVKPIDGQILLETLLICEPIELN